MATTVTIGRNIPKHASGRQAPMSSVSWQRFQRDTLATIRTYVTDVYFVGQGGGIYAGDAEDAFTVIADEVDSEDIPAFYGAIRTLATKYHQECIAVTIGQTELVGL